MAGRIPDGRSSITREVARTPRPERRSGRRGHVRVPLRRPHLYGEIMCGHGLAIALRGSRVTEENWDDEEFRRKWQEQSDKIGRFNLAIFGKTGVGKSTLINAVFGREVAKTGIGKPVTVDGELHIHDNEFLGILDGPGLEIGKDSDQIIKDLAKLIRDRRKSPESEQMHVAWYCVRANGGRFEDTEADFIRRLSELDLPVIVVLTQAASREGKFHPDAVALSDHISELDLPIEGGRPLMVMAEEDFSGGPAHGLKELLDATFQAAPEGVRVALIAAQKVDLGRKFNQAQIRIGVASTAVAAASVWVKDDRALLLIVVGLTAEIARVYGIPKAVATVAWGAAAKTFAFGSKGASSRLLALVPQEKVGTKDVVTGAIAAALTAAIGYAWAYVCGQIAQGKLDGVEGILDDTLVRDVFLSQFKFKWP